MKHCAAFLLLALAGCAGVDCQPLPEPAEELVAARRALEVHAYPRLPPAEALAHAADVLLDLDCAITEIDGETGVLAGTGRTECLAGREQQRVLPASSPAPGLLGRVMSTPSCFQTCAGQQLTVSVARARAGGSVVRATPLDRGETATRTFHQLFERSLELAGETAP